MFPVNALEKLAQAIREGDRLAIILCADSTEWNLQPHSEEALYYGLDLEELTEWNLVRRITEIIMTSNLSNRVTAQWLAQFESLQEVHDSLREETRIKP